jgi:hypothetical protein
MRKGRQAEDALCSLEFEESGRKNEKRKGSDWGTSRRPRAAQGRRGSGRCGHVARRRGGGWPGRWQDPGVTAPGRVAHGRGLREGG